MTSGTHEVVFYPSNIRVKAADGRNLLSLIRELGIDLTSECGGNGTCGKCRVCLEPQVVSGNGGSFSQERARGKSRLACRYDIVEDIAVVVPEANRAAIRVLDRGVRAQYPFRPPALQGPLKSARPGGCYGAAVDIGTTTVVVALVDLRSGTELATRSARNPQSIYGLDVLNRARYGQTEKQGMADLQRKVVSLINTLVPQACSDAGVNRVDIVEVCLAGNQFMLRFLRQEDTSDLTMPPYDARSCASEDLNASELGIEIADRGKAYLLPAASAFIGADIVAGLVAVDIDSWPRPLLFIDIGTNGEMVLADEEGLSACSTAAGPAFEGVNISCGVSAVPGAVEGVFLDDVKKLLSLQVIGGGQPIGLCGTGLMDMVAELVRVGIIDRTGRFGQAMEHFGYANDEHAGLLRAIGQGRSFVVEDRRTGKALFSLSQRDVREVQLAKAAIRAGMDLLLNERGLGLRDLRTVLIAGGFGHKLRPESLVHLGILSPELCDRVEVVGNTSLSGAYLTLVSEDARRRAEGLSTQINTVSLSLHPEFEQSFIRNMAFPKALLK